MMGRRRCLVTTDAVGGVWRYSLELAAALQADVVLAVLGPKPDAAQRREAEAVPGVKLVTTSLPLDWNAADATALHNASRSLADLARVEGVDVVHLHAPALAGDVSWPTPVVVVAHSCVATWWRALRCGPISDDLAWRAAATAAGLRHANAVIAPSNAFAAQLRIEYGDELRLTVIYNGRRRVAVPAAVRERSVLSVGRLWDDAKNFDALDRCAALLDAPVLVAGPGGQVKSFGHLKMLGVLDEAPLAHALARAGAFVSLARYEPFGLAVLEAAQAGLPLVLSDIVPFHELWEGAAIFVNPDDASGVATILRTLLESPERQTELGEQACRHAERYSAATMALRTAAVHDRVLSAAGRRAA